MWTGVGGSKNVILGGRHKWMAPYKFKIYQKIKAAISFVFGILV